MSDFEFNIKSNVDAFAKELDEWGREQLPFAVSKAINKLGKMVVAGEGTEIKDTFPTATPFTLKGTSFIPANKRKLEGVVFVKDIQAEYLEPYEYDGKSIPAGPAHVAMLRPVGINVNQYGNIPYQRIKTLKGRSNIFDTSKSKIGGVKLKDGRIIRGIFQRLKGGKGGPRLKILVRFADPKQVQQHLHFFDTATKICEKNLTAALNEAMDYALATKK